MTYSGQLAALLKFCFRSNDIAMFACFSSILESQQNKNTRHFILPKAKVVRFFFFGDLTLKNNMTPATAFVAVVIKRSNLYKLCCWDLRLTYNLTGRVITVSIFLCQRPISQCNLSSVAFSCSILCVLL